MINWGTVPSGAVLPFMFGSYAVADGASITLTGLAVTDVEIYKGASVTQRASDAGVVLIDTDGIDIDSTTGIHGFSIDTGDNTDAGFYAVGSFFTVVVASVTIDGETVNFVAGTFRLSAAEHTAGYPVSTIKDGTGTGEIDTTSGGVLVAAIAAGAITATAIADNAIDAGAIAADAITAAKIADGAIDAATFAANAITSTVLANDAITAAKLAADVTTELQSGLATAAALATVDGIVDDILVDTGTTLQGELDGIQATLGVAGAGLTAVVWNAAWDAEVESEVTDALNAYDPPTNAEMVARTIASASYATASALATAAGNIDAILVDTGTTLQGELDALQVILEKLDDTLEDDAGTFRFTTNALEQAPSGTGASAATIADAVWDEARAGHVGAGSFGEGVIVVTNSDKTGYRLSTTGVDDLWDEVVDGSITARQAMRILNASQAGKLSGAATTTITIRDPADTADRIVATVDANGNRSAVTLTL